MERRSTAWAAEQRHHGFSVHWVTSATTAEKSFTTRKIWMLTWWMVTVMILGGVGVYWIEQLFFRMMVFGVPWGQILFTLLNIVRGFWWNMWREFTLFWFSEAIEENASKDYMNFSRNWYCTWITNTIWKTWPPLWSFISVIAGAFSLLWLVFQGLITTGKRHCCIPVRLRIADMQSYFD